MAGLTVRDAMSTIVVSVSPDDTLREAARRMTDRGVGVAVVAEGGGPPRGLISERDLLRSIGRGADVDEERVRQHLTVDTIYAFAAWPLERAAERMTAGGFRHVAVVDKAGHAIAILSMRDIVRCWVSRGHHGRRRSEPAPA